jgi:ABC-type multidrug transport system ATPase subunit
VLSFDITISNYRCFSVEQPARLEVRPRILALVGPNNAGKSTLLRFFFEFRPLFTALADEQSIRNISSGALQGLQLAALGDPLEIFNNSNGLPVQIQLRVHECSDRQLSGIDITFRRDSLNTYSAKLRVGPTFQEVQFNNAYPNAIVSGSSFTTDTSVLKRLGSILSSTLYLPATRIAIGESQGNSYDLQFGHSFISLWDQWKTGPNRMQNDAIQRVTEDIRLLFGFGRLEIAATPDKRDLHIAVDGKAFKLRELGSGLAQFIMVLANVAVKRPMLLLIDEPEISLHPSLQLDFLTTIASNAAGATLFATHSLALARAADAVISVQREGDHSVAKPFEDTTSFQEFLGEMSFAAYRDLGFDAVLAVEGVNDIKTIQQFLRILEKDHRVVIIQLGGSQMIRPQRAQELSELLRLTKNVHALIDSERESASLPLEAVRSDFLNACTELNIRAIASARRAMEHYISDRAAKIAFGEKFRSLTEYEGRSNVLPIWGKSESWRAAREMTKEELLQTDVGQFLDKI